MNSTHHTPTPPLERKVGIAYMTWHKNTDWTNLWGTPATGFMRPMIAPSSANMTEQDNLTSSS